MKGRTKSETPSDWASEQYWAKGVSYVARFEDQRHGSPEAALTAALSVEFLARAALTHAHPALNADPQQEGSHLFYAVGLQAWKPPKTLPIHAVLGRLVRLFPEQFSPTHQKSAERLVERRNKELHTAAMAFVGLKEAEWLADYYDFVLAVAAILGRSPKDVFITTEKVRAAKALVRKHSADRRAAITKRISVRKKRFSALKPSIQVGKRNDAAVRNSSDPAASTTCPACKSSMSLVGLPISASEPEVQDGELVIRAVYLVSRASCRACGLVLRSSSEVGIAGIPLRFERLEEYDLHADREHEDYEEYDNM